LNNSGQNNQNNNDQNKNNNSNDNNNNSKNNNVGTSTNRNGDEEVTVQLNGFDVKVTIRDDVRFLPPYAMFSG
jgi:hypothetical protein